MNKRQSALEALRETKRFIAAFPEVVNESPMEKYRDDPVGYAEDVLNVKLWHKQEDILRSLLKHPHRTLVKSGHSIGKSFLAAVATCWWYDTRPRSVVITSGPSAESVREIVWKEIRILRTRSGLGGFHGSEMPLLKSGPDHYAKGYTTDSGERFQGRHDLEMLFIFDEAVGIPRIFWETVSNGMFKAAGGHAWLAIFNPTDTTSQACREEVLMDGGKPKWFSVQMSALDHPNIAAQLRGEPPPYPAAVTIDQIWTAIHEGCVKIKAEDRRSIDFQFPPGSGQWWRPGPIFCSRWLGIWPEISDGIWSDALLRACLIEQTFDWGQRPVLGIDVARKGDDWTCFHVRQGNCSIYHARYNGWPVTQTAGEAIRLARHFAAESHAQFPAYKPQQMRINIDDDGVGGGVTDIVQAEGFAAVAVNAGCKSYDPTKYPNIRSQLWFDTKDRALMGMLDLSRIDAEMFARIRQQAMAPTWKVDAAGRRVVEPKDETKKKLGISPDDMDAVDLAYYVDGGSGRDDALPFVLTTRNNEPSWMDLQRQMQNRRG